MTGVRAVTPLVASSGGLRLLRYSDFAYEYERELPLVGEDMYDPDHPDPSRPDRFVNNVADSFSAARSRTTLGGRCEPDTAAGGDSSHASPVPVSPERESTRKPGTAYGS